MKKRISLLLSVWLAVSSALCGCNMVLQKNEKIQELCGFTRQQVRMTTEKMRSEDLIELVGKGRGARYILKKCVSKCV